MPKKKKETEPVVRDEILTIEAGDIIETPEEKERAAWGEIRNAYRSHKILSGRLDAVEEGNDMDVAVVYYNEFRVAIPLTEMMIQLNGDPETSDFKQRLKKIVGRMLGAEIDFVIVGLDDKERIIAASRKEAMMKKRNSFFMKTDDNGAYRITEGKVVQARVIAVAEKVLRVEVFGVETSILARDISWDWMGDVREFYHVGDRVLVRVNTISRESPETLSVTADIRSTTVSRMKEKLSQCKIQGRYAGTVTDIYNGMVYLTLSNGVNAIAPVNFDFRTPAKKDEVSFILMGIDNEKNVAHGIITRILLQNL